jgi:hypothetical protein
MPTLFNITCVHCNKNFTAIPRQKNKKFCDKTCYKAYIKNHNKLDNCLVCGSELNRSLQNKFCSASCSATHNNQQRSTQSRKKQSASLRNTLFKLGKNRSDPKDNYYAECSFKYWSTNVWNNIPGFELVSSIGMFHPIDNPNGAVRDHIVSKQYGWKNSIPSSVISHPANCQIITNYQNIKKGTRSDLSLKILLERIQNWDTI